jgi:protocatechuate 3,4-dioxygenase beta subunit
MLGGMSLGVVGLVACGSDDDSSSSTSAAGTSAAATSATSATTATTATSASSVATVDSASSASSDSCAEIPDETGGPYPGDGTNGVNVLTEDGIVRRDITASFGSSTTVADGVPLEVVLTLQDISNGCSPMAGAAVYLWHCDAAGDYSLYSDGVTGENYLRGVHEADANGQVTFTTIFPGCYSGRWPHIHFEVDADPSSATSGSNNIKTSQLAFPQSTCDTVYADPRYPQSASNLGQISLSSDNVFGEDRAALQLATMSGSNDAGYAATLAVGA